MSLLRSRPLESAGSEAAITVAAAAIRVDRLDAEEVTIFTIVAPLLLLASARVPRPETIPSAPPHSSCGALLPSPTAFGFCSRPVLWQPCDLPPSFPLMGDRRLGRLSSAVGWARPAFSGMWECGRLQARTRVKLVHTLLSQSFMVGGRARRGR